MRIQIISDVHTEFQRDWGESFIESMDSDGVDVLVIAGDLSTKDQLKMNLRGFCKKYPHVVYTPGNHEFYGSSFGDVRKTLSEINDCPNLHILDNKSVEIMGQKFVGCTLWFRNGDKNCLLEKHMNDFRTIKDFGKEVYGENERSLEFLKENVCSNSVVVTHHMPSTLSIGKMWVKHPLNVFFLCDLDEFICERKPKIWFHGHTHDSFDYVLDKTRIVCNPFGYVGSAINPSFDDKKIIEI